MTKSVVQLHNSPMHNNYFYKAKYFNHAFIDPAVT